MRVMGLVPSSTDLKIALLEGTRAEPRILASQKSQRLPADPCEGHALFSLHRLLSTLFREQGVERLCILQGGTSQYRGPSPIRIKAEGIIQLVGAELNISTDLVPPQTLRAQEKRFESVAGGNPEAVLNEGDEFKPKPWRDAVLVGWWGLTA